MLPKINSAMLIVTHACTLACRYCFVQQESSRMSFKTAKRAAEFLIENAVWHGLPLVVVKVLCVFRACSKQNFFY